MTDLRCSLQSRSIGELPGGSATMADRFVLAELPQPWPSRIEDHPLLADLPAAPRSLGSTRVLAIRRSDDNPRSAARIIVYTHTPGAPFESYAGFEVDVPAADLVSVLATVHAGDHTGLRPLAGTGTDDGPTRDVLICTHGSRDRCCGQVGSLLFLELAGRLPTNVRLWRTSHTGGHRFAPTGITFPDGLTWAFLDAHLLSRIINRSLTPGELHSHLRGCAAFDPPEQVADAAAFAHAGWSWVDQPRAMVRRLVSTAAMKPEHEIYAAGPRRQFTVRVVEDDPVPVPPCGQPVDESTKSTPQFVVTAITDH